MSTSMAQYMCEHYGWDDGWVDDPGFYANDDDDSQAYSSAEEECPRCNTGKLKLREGRYGKFWGVF